MHIASAAECTITASLTRRRTRAKSQTTEEDNRQQDVQTRHFLKPLWRQCRPDYRGQQRPLRPLRENLQRIRPTFKKLTHRLRTLQGLNEHPQYFGVAAGIRAGQEHSAQ